ncbi:MAG: PDZ domain-containing protein, partial [Candidatus Omnitrophota bacterium]
MNKKIIVVTIVLIWGTNLSTSLCLAAKPDQTKTPAHYAPYLELLEEVYRIMDENYYQPISEKIYAAYVEKYKKSVLAKLKNTSERIDMVAYRGAGLLVKNLKDREDKFSNFFPPKKAEEYSQLVYGYENGIGISGHKENQTYLIDYVQKRSDSYRKNIRGGDSISEIDGNKTADLTDEEIHAYLYPPLDTEVKLKVFSAKEKKTFTYEILCEEYFID